jgi:hypothetical protein
MTTAIMLEVVAIAEIVTDLVVSIATVTPDAGRFDATTLHLRIAALNTIAVHPLPRRSLRSPHHR